MTGDIPHVAAALLDEAIQVASSLYRTPTATYRLQMNAKFNLRDAIAIVPYLERLGISHLYVSSLLMARPGSMHGYDVINHSRLNPELGTESDLTELAAELRHRGMGLILDVVPNHMCIGEGNEWWMDVLENGSASPFATFFDIAWRNHPRERLRGKVLLPILDEPYGKAIQAGRFRPFFDQGRFGVAIDQVRLPLDPRTYEYFLSFALDAIRVEKGEDAPGTLELQSILTAVRHLPPRDSSDPEHAAEAMAEGIVIKRRLRDLVNQGSDVASHFDRAVSAIAGKSDDPNSFRLLIELLDSQAYRPCFWRVALDEINYRRFFDVNDLAALNTEHGDVFQSIHAKVFAWLSEGIISGLRIDHIDGLREPKEYLDRLQRYYLISLAHSLWNAKKDEDATSWTDIEAVLLSQLEDSCTAIKPLLYVVVEKILGHREQLPATWVCHGTTGYEFLNEVNSIFIDADSEELFTHIYQQFTNETNSFDAIAYEKKLQILRSTMASELHMLAHQLDRLAQSEWWSQDFTLNGLRHALEEMVACFPVYRTYVSKEASTVDRNIILRSARRARKMIPLLGREIFDFICNTLLLQEPDTAPASAEYHNRQRRFAGRFQQLTSPVMAKGVEDTAFYVFNRLASLNEVGGDPARFGSSPRELHSFLQNRESVNSGGLSTLATHDTKRSEDVRARINVLSEVPEQWSKRIRAWRGLNQSFKVELDDGTVAPSDNEEYFLYQTLVGAWSCHSESKVDHEFVTRIQAYMQKVLREAKVHSSWIRPDSKYESAVAGFVDAILNSEISACFLNDLRELCSFVHPIGKLNSLSQTLIRCMAPGIPDCYQGCESWDYSLVDPDNRRPVDYIRHKEMLDSFEQLDAQQAKTQRQLWRETITSESAKLSVIARALQVRRRCIDVFRNGAYVPLESTGPDANHLFAFLMSDGTSAVMTVIPRLICKLSHTCWDSTTFQLRLNAALTIPDEWTSRVWKNEFTGRHHESTSRQLSADALLEDLPIALMTLRAS